MSSSAAVSSSSISAVDDKNGSAPSASAGSSASNGLAFFPAPAQQIQRTNNSDSPLVHADDNKLAVQARVDLLTSKRGDTKTDTKVVESYVNQPTVKVDSGEHVTVKAEQNIDKGFQLCTMI